MRMTGGEAIVAALLANGVDTVFGLPGAQMYPVFDAVHQHSNAIRFVGSRHEQGCAYMAFGYARSTGRPGVFAVVPGPGLLNASAALCTAAGCNAPVLCITGQIPSPFIGRGRGHLHELRDQLATMRSLVKWAARIERPADAPAVMDEAFRQMLSGRPGPVVVEMAWDVMASSGKVAPLPAATIPAALPPAPEEIEAAARLVRTAKRPMIVTGSGAQHAAAAVQALARALGAPVASFRGGRGIMPEDDALGLSSYAARLLWPDTDVLIGIGSRLEMPYMRWAGMMQVIDAPSPPPHLVRIDIDPAEMLRLRPHAGIVADAAAGAEALRTALAGVQANDRPDIAAAKQRAAAEIRPAPHIDYIDVIRAELPRDGFFVKDLCQAGFASYFGFPVYEPRTYVTSGFQGTLGFGFPSALGVKVAHPDKPVVSITGDGGFMFAVQELATAAQYGLGVTTIVFDNSSFGNVARDQETGFGGRLIGAEFRNPDFVDLAKTFGVEAHRVESAEALRPVLSRALGSSGPVLIHVVVDRKAEASPWPFILKW